MEQYAIKGGNPLVGEVEIGGAKNAALPILAASIMTDETVYIDNVPDVRSKDNSWEKLQTFAGNPKVKLFNQEVNRGKGAALIRGFSEATMPFVMVQDADFEYDPDDYPTVLAPLVAGKADVVYG